MSPLAFRAQRMNAEPKRAIGSTMHACIASQSCGRNVTTSSSIFAWANSLCLRGHRGRASAASAHERMALVARTLELTVASASVTKPNDSNDIHSLHDVGCKKKVGSMCNLRQLQWRSTWHERAS